MEKLMTESFPKLLKDTRLQLQELQQMLSRIYEPNPHLDKASESAKHQRQRGKKMSDQKQIKLIYEDRCESRT